MYGKWSQWKPTPDIPGKMYTEKLIETYDGLEITLKALDDSCGIKIIFDNSVISYQITDEGNRWRTLDFLEETYGTVFYANRYSFLLKTIHPTYNRQVHRYHHLL